jgi:hypothetical protein
VNKVYQLYCASTVEPEASKPPALLRSNAYSAIELHGKFLRIFAIRSRSS